MGPLSRTWYAIEASLGASRENHEEISWKDLSQSVEQTVLLLGQAFNAFSYHRRLNVLSAIMSDKKKAKVTLKDESKLLEIPTEDNLFWKKISRARNRYCKDKEEIERSLWFGKKVLIIDFNNKRFQTALSRGALIGKETMGAF